MNVLKPTSFKRIVFFTVSDLVLSAFTFLIAYGLRFNFEIPELFISSFFNLFLLLFILKLVFFMYYRIYFVAWRFFSLEDARKLLLAHIFAYSTFTLIILQHFELFSPFPRSVIGIDFVLSLFL